MARLDELERKFEENPRRYFAPLANEYRKAGDAAKAAELCRSQLPDVPGHISGHIVLGQALFDSGDFAGARAALETALALDPENIVALRYLGDIARNTGDGDEAERWYARTLEADPYNEAATQGLQALREGDAAPAGEAAAEAASPEAPAPATAEVEPDQPRPDALETNAIEAAETPILADEPGESAEATTEPPVQGALAEGFEPTAHATDETEERSAEPVAAEEPETAAEAVAEHEPTVLHLEVKPVEDVPVEEVAGTAEFAGDLAISAASESADESNGEQQPAEALPAEAPAAEAEVSQAAVDETAPSEATGSAVEFPSAVADEPAPGQAEPAERFDEAAHEPPDASAAADAPDPVPVDEAMQAEERVMESAAPFVTETMADLYLEQGYPHEALELLLQLAEARPDDERLREKVAHIESVIAARRDAAVAAARAERAERAETAHAAVAEVDSSPFVESQDSGAALAFEIPPFLPAEEEAPTTVRELFARMDRARPRPASSVTPRPLSRLRSDFVPMPDPGATASEPVDDPFAFPDAPPPEQRAPRTSGPQPTFNPSTADIDDFEAWLRGLKGP